MRRLAALVVAASIVVGVAPVALAQVTPAPAPTPAASSPAGLNLDGFEPRPAPAPAAPSSPAAGPQDPRDDDCAAKHGLGAAACEVADLAGDAAKGVARGVGGLAAEAGKSALGTLGFATDNEAEGFFRQTLTTAAKGAADALNSAKDMVMTSTQPDIASEWFQRYFNRMVVAVAPILVIFTLIGIARAHSFAGVWIGFSRGLEAMAMTAAAVFILTLALIITDAATNVIAGSAATNTASVFTQLGTKLVELTHNGVIGTLVLGIAVGLGLLGAALAWINLAARGVGIEILTGLIPLVMALSVLHHFKGMRTKLVTFLGGLVLSLFIIVAIASLAINKLTAPDLGVTGVVQASATVLSSVILPWLLLGFIAGVAVDAAVGRAEALRNRATSAAKSAKDNVHHKFVERFSKGEGSGSSTSKMTLRYDSLGMLGMGGAESSSSAAGGSAQVFDAKAVKAKADLVAAGQGAPPKPPRPKVPDYWEGPGSSLQTVRFKGSRAVVLGGAPDVVPPAAPAPKPPPRPVTPIATN